MRLGDHYSGAYFAASGLCAIADHLDHSGSAQAQKTAAWLREFAREGSHRQWPEP
jgi:hypothetical protein